MSAVISFVMAVVTFFSGFTAEIGFAFAESVFSDVLSLMVQRADFLEDINDDSVVEYTESAGYIENTVLVFFEQDASFFSRLDVLRKAQGVTVGSLPDMNLCVVRTSNKNLDELNSLCAQLNKLDAVAFASICPARKLGLQYTPDDPFTDYDLYEEHWNESSPYGNNWWLEAVDARGAWGYGSLFSQIDIGVIDGGFDTDHVELDGKIYFPDRSSASRNRDNSHGTHVAGIISAKADNGVGISGICQNSKLICYDWTPSDGQLWIADVAIFFGFNKVAKSGARVINLSIGSSSSIPENSSSFPKFINNLDAKLYSFAMGSLLKKGYDFLVVQSAGNGNDGGHAVNASQNGVFCPINEGNMLLPIGISKKDILDRIIIVGSAAREGDGYVQSPSSNVGDTVDICAPGVSVYSCVQDDSYLTKSGTSMAAPVVTAIASLVWSVNPKFTAAQVAQIVLSSTKDTVAPSSQRRFENAGYKAYPLVNAKLSVEAALLQRGGVYRVNFSGYSDEEVVFTNTDGDEFVFETNEKGQLSCVLPQGTYKVVSDGINKTVDIQSDTEISIGG